MHDIALFLRSRLAEAEAVSGSALAWLNDANRRAGRPDWPRGFGFDVVSTTEGHEPVVAAWCAEPAVLAHVVLWDIHRTRWVLHMTRSVMEDHALTEGKACVRCIDVVAGRPMPCSWPCTTYRMLTWPWATHGDFADEWLR